MFPKTEENGNGNGNGDGTHAPEGGSGHAGYVGGMSVDHQGNVIDQGAAWQNTFLGPLIQKHWGINPVTMSFEPTQAEINQAQAEAQHDFGNQGTEESAGGGWTVG